MIRSVAISCLLVSTAVLADDPVEFNRDVRPILSNRCFACHGPDEQSREADLRLDDPLEATRSDLGAIVPGFAEESELIRRIESSDPSEVMPPPEHGEALTSDEIELLRRWIDQGLPISSTGLSRNSNVRKSRRCRPSRRAVPSMRLFGVAWQRRRSFLRSRQMLGRLCDVCRLI